MMSLESGKVTFVRWRVAGEAPDIGGILETLHDHRFQPSTTCDEVELGFCAGGHLFDVDFEHDKNVFRAGQCVAFAVRIDTNKPPPNLEKSYQRWHETSLSRDNPSGFASKAQKLEAKELAARDIQTDRAAGKFRKRKLIGVWWYPQRGRLYTSSHTSQVVEQLVSLMHAAFGVEMQLVSPGALAAGELSERDFEDVKPARLCAAPWGAQGEVSTEGTYEIPSVPWVARAIDLKDFLGNEFAVWLWHHVANDDQAIVVDAQQDRTIYVALGRRIVMQCAWGVHGKATLETDGIVNSAEAAQALRSGMWPRQIALLVAGEGGSFELTLHADMWAVKAAALPDVPDAETPGELISARLNLIDALTDQLDSLFARFLAIRMSGEWETERDRIERWTQSMATASSQ